MLETLEFERFINAVINGCWPSCELLEKIEEITIARVAMLEREND